MNINYKVQIVNLENGYTIIHVFPTIDYAIDFTKSHMASFSTNEFRITITTTSNEII